MNRKSTWTVSLNEVGATGWEICTYNLYDLTRYGKTWLAYRRKPEPEGGTEK